MKRDPYENAKSQISQMVDSVDVQWLKKLAAKKRAGMAPEAPAPAEDLTEVLSALESV
ncbi:MAG: hypothetical protein NTV51_03890 [Verrucomicrobia bacterium]|nr:hypothetical protein [Verrucomicrobiota bacterium]